MLYRSILTFEENTLLPIPNEIRFLVDLSLYDLTDLRTSGHTQPFHKHNRFLSPDNLKHCNNKTQNHHLVHHHHHHHHLFNHRFKNKIKKSIFENCIECTQIRYMKVSIGHNDVSSNRVKVQSVAVSGNDVHVFGVKYVYFFSFSRRS